MIMKNYLFNLSNNEERTVKEISNDNSYYKLYDKYLDMFYGETIETNSDFIPFDIGDKIIIVQQIEDIDDEFTENIFDVMQDMLYMRA